MGKDKLEKYDEIELWLLGRIKRAETPLDLKIMAEALRTFVSAKLDVLGVPYDV